MEEADKQPLFTCAVTVETGAEKHCGVTAALFEDALSLSSSRFRREMKLASLSGIRARDYRIYVGAAGCEIVLSMIGHQFEDFARKLIRAYNEVLFHELLMKETVRFETEGTYTSPAGEEVHAAVRICETAVVILPDTHNLVRIPFCMVSGTDIQPYRFTITDRMGRAYALSKMGYNTDAFLRAYAVRQDELIRQTKDKLSEIFPADDRLAMLLMEGLVQPFEEIRSISPGFASALGKKLSASGIVQEYAYLNEISDDLAVGVKRGLMGELTGETILLLAPVFAKNALIMESYGDVSAATYVFRLPGGAQADRAQWKRFLLEFNEAMLSVNFRREPIYLSDAALQEPQYIIYQNAVRRVPALERLRALFVGRAMHSGFETWKKKIEDLIDQGG